jgi:hypothetical protein
MSHIEQDVQSPEQKEMRQSPSALEGDARPSTDVHPDQIMDGPILSVEADEDFQSIPDGIDLVSDPKSIALETLYTLQLFLDNLIGLCARISEEKEAAVREASYQRLIEGIETVMESILTARTVLRIGIHPQVNLLEADLLSILKDMLDATEQGNTAYQEDLIKTHLPQNLREWRHEGIPEMIRCRDS